MLRTLNYHTLIKFITAILVAAILDRPSTAKADKNQSISFYLSQTIGL